MPVPGGGERIYDAVKCWEQIAARPHRLGGTEFRVGRREVGHVHGDSLVDIPFPLGVRDELIRSGAAEPHQVLPKSGWVSVYLRRPVAAARWHALFTLALHRPRYSWDSIALLISS